MVLLSEGDLGDLTLCIPSHPPADISAHHLWTGICILLRALPWEVLGTCQGPSASRRLVVPLVRWGSRCHQLELHSAIPVAGAQFYIGIFVQGLVAPFGNLAEPTSHLLPLVPSARGWAKHCLRLRSFACPLRLHVSLVFILKARCPVVWAVNSC
jgi:hypothetical protein